MKEIDLDIKMVIGKSPHAKHLYAKVGDGPEDTLRRSFTKSNSEEQEIDIWLEEVTLRLKEKIMGW